MRLVREVTTARDYGFVDGARKEALTAFRGIAFILNCQVRVDGKLTVWCAQHDEVDFRPQSARSYELATLSGAESVGITRLLISIDAPLPDVVQAVKASADWFENVKLTGIRVVDEKDAKGPRVSNKVVVKDPLATALWARFYEIGTNKPLFVDRDGVPKLSLADIGYERRYGYVWYGTWPQKLLAVDYPAWNHRCSCAGTD